ncbi:aminoacyl-tRNA deacylase [Nocardia sp. NPDC101769]|uniref:aminoacyl-tRNA deacylase n=1 Tax=Nocardia sp. NPDC101769 TaxID=3364333 RepID=UPI0037FB6F93
MSISPTVQQCLNNSGIKYEIVRHPHSHSSSETAETAHIPGDHLAKTIVLEDELGYVAAVVPSTHHLRLAKLRAQTGRRLALAKESDIRETFKDCEVGAIPPMCTAYGMTTLMDESLATAPDIYFEAGDHETLVHLQTDEFMRLMEQAEKTRFSHHKQSIGH